jgi:hypothetical protein
MNRSDAVPLPDRMRQLPRDPRGYPIPHVVYRDGDGRAHFTINDTPTVLRVLKDDLCTICGQRLLRGRWFIGGPRSAFDPRGAYIDPPVHGECGHYALMVCPYLALPSYAKRIDDRTLAPDDPIHLFADDRCDNTRPEVFVAVHARGQKVERRGLQQITIKPTRPYIAVEYWRHGKRLSRTRRGEAF